MSSFYHNYFAKDKPLRHYTQHLLVATFSFIVIVKVFSIEISLTTILLFAFFSFIVDLDGAICIFTTQRKKPEVIKIRQAIRKLDFIEVSTLATTHHKIFDRLVLHNVLGLAGFLFLFILFSVKQYDIGTLSIGAILAHFSFDIIDDVYQLGHINNWLWPITSWRKFWRQYP